MHQCIAVPLILAATQDQPAVRVNLRLHSQPMLCPCCRRLSRVNRAWAANEGRAASTNHVSRREQELLEKWLRAWEEQEKNQFFKLIKAVDKGRPFDYTLVCTRPPPAPPCTQTLVAHPPPVVKHAHSGPAARMPAGLPGGRTFGHQTPWQRQVLKRAGPVTEAHSCRVRTGRYLQPMQLQMHWQCR